MLGLKQFGYLFYIANPKETTFKKIEDVPQFTTEVIPLLFLVYVLEVMVAKCKKVKYHRTNDSVTNVTQGLLMETTKLFIRGFQVCAYVWIYDNWRLVTLPWNSVWTWLLCFVGVDFFFYWAHRASHEVNILWAVHQIHHQSEELNITTAFRQPMFNVYIISIFYLPLALGIPPAVFVVHHELNLLYQVWIHTRLFGKLGLLEYILNTPSHHRVHHGRNRYCIDKNYAGVLIVWDRMFGTFQMEDEEVVFGLTHPTKTFDPIAIQFSGFSTLAKQFWNIKGFRNKLSVLFKGPGWSPGKPRLGYIEDIPEVHGPQVKYDPPLPMWCIVYLNLHSYMLLIFFGDLAFQHKKLSQLIVIGGVMYCFITQVSFGAIMDNKYWAPLLEGIRCFLYCYVDFYILPAMERDIYPITVGLRTVFFLSSLLWIFKQKYFSISFNRKPHNK